MLFGRKCNWLDVIILSLYCPSYAVFLTSSLQCYQFQYTTSTSLSTSMGCTFWTRASQLLSSVQYTTSSSSSSTSVDCTPCLSTLRALSSVDGISSPPTFLLFSFPLSPSRFSPFVLNWFGRLEMIEFRLNDYASFFLLFFSPLVHRLPQTTNPILDS